jgi:hypothetical protein
MSPDFTNGFEELDDQRERHYDVFEEVVIIAGYLEKKGLLEAFAHQVPLVRGRFGTYEPIDFLALLIGYARSFERTRASFFERVEPFESAKMRALRTPMSSSPLQFESRAFPMSIARVWKRSARSREQQTFADGWTSETIGGIFASPGSPLSGL